MHCRWGMQRGKQNSGHVSIRFYNPPWVLWPRVSSLKTDCSRDWISQTTIEGGMRHMSGMETAKRTRGISGSMFLLVQNNIIIINHETKRSPHFPISPLWFYFFPFSFTDTQNQLFAGLQVRLEYKENVVSTKLNFICIAHFIQM